MNLRLLTLAFVLFSTAFVFAEEEPNNIAAPYLERQTITGEWFGTGPRLYEDGITLFSGYTAEVWGNTAGGLKTGAVYTGLLDFGAELDLEKTLGWQGAKVGTTWLWLSGRDASEDLVGNFLTISNIAGFNTLRMMQLWLEQNFLDDKISLRIGQIAADADFIVSDYAGLFINAQFGWSAIAGMNMPNGGPAYPVGGLGARLLFSPSDSFALLSAVYQGNVLAQDVNRHGFRWRLDAEDGFTWLNEAQFFWGNTETAKILPGFLKAGLWFQTGNAADALASSTGSGNSGYYLVLEQMVMREKTETDEAMDQGLGFFARSGFTPPDRNLIDFFFDAGVTFKGLIPRRDEDTIGLAFGCASVSNGFQNEISNAGGRPASAEMVLEGTYQCTLTPWCIVQPDVQFILNPGADRSIANALVIGGRVSLVF
jgi:porin